jgi:hypothetical protein
MDNLKPFDVGDIDESLTRVVAHRGSTYLMFPFVSALEATPQFHSISLTIKGTAATLEDFSGLSALAKKSAVDNAAWFISFSTPWLIPASEVANLRTRGSLRKRQ